MKCPVDVDIDLQMMERQGVEIDYCPKCRGVWLDRGELDKIIDRSMSENPVAGYDDNQYRGGKHGSRQGRRRGFLGELFD